MRTRNISIPIRVTEKELEAIDKKAAKAKLDRTNFMIAAALGKKITLVEDLKPMLQELRRIGNNLNQLTRLANAGAIQSVELDDVRTTLGDIYSELFHLANKEDVGKWQCS
ncbi:MAG: plasmid mobilization protein [Eubacteriales bacterium]